MTINFNAEPYYDDFNESNKFYKILFKPGYAVQTRELNQLQSIIQGQINTHGKHLFREGSMVIPGATSIDTNASYVKLQAGVVLTDLQGATLTGVVSGVTAEVVFTVAQEGTDPDTIYVKYTSSGTDSITKVFADNEILLDSTGTAVAITVLTGATGNGSIASIQSGFYFVKQTFVYVPDQTIVLGKYSNTPSYKVGLDTIERFVTSDENYTLLDNAQGSYNYAAPGADRYVIDLLFTKKNIDVAKAGSFIIGANYTIAEVGTTDFTLIGSPDNVPGTTFVATDIGSGTGTAIINEADFIQLILVRDGKVVQKIDSTQYAYLEQTLARRTYDESGDYTIRNFPIDVREYRNNFRGDWVAYGKYLAGDVVLSGSKYYRCRKDGTANGVAPVQPVGSTTSTATGVVWTFEANPFFNRGVYDVDPAETLAQQNTNKDKLAIGIEPGKAYVRGYEIEKIATSYVPVNKAREVQQQVNIKIPATIGNYVIVNNLNALPDISTFPLVTLRDQLSLTPGVAAGNAIGTARVRFIEFNNDTTPGTQATKYKVSLFDVKLNDGYSFTRDVKQMFIAGGNAATSFSADIFPTLTQLTGSVSASASETLVGQGTLFQSEVLDGDYISVDGDVRRVVTVISNTEILMDAPLTVTGSVFYLITTALLETGNETLLFPATHPFVSLIADEDDNVNTSYTAAKLFSQASNLGGEIVIQVSNADTFASPADIDNYLVLDVATGNIVVPSLVEYGTSTQEIKITTGTAAVRDYTIIAAVNRAGSATQKTKTLTTETIAFTSRAAASTSTILLGKTDGFRILEVKMDTGTFIAPTGIYDIDVTNRYSFDDGQRSTHYDICSISLNQGESTPSAPIQVVFEYFSHSTNGDHFTVNSYLSTIAYDEIPLYRGVPLSYMFDFRPTINNAGTSFDVPTLLPKRGVDIQSDFRHYLGRKDKIAMNQDGNLFSISGTSALRPVEPSDISTGMILYKIEYQPYTYTSNSVTVQTIDNKRYTMRDIGKLEKRIDNIEYYTSLSMLEQQAQSLEIQDETGFNRFKNGFIVDNFTGHGIGDSSGADYKCSIDMENGLMRPKFYMDNINLIESNLTDTQRNADGYATTGDLITLPYTEVELIKQMDASTVENINPFAIFTFLGSIDLNPPSDEWFETNRLPDIITNVEGNFNSIYSEAEASGALSGIYNAWQTQWTGVVETKRQTFSNTRGVQQIGNTTVDIGSGGGSGVVRSVVAEVQTSLVGQSRTGIKTIVVPKVDIQQTADRTLSVAVIPYIRARSLMFVVKGMKPNTSFYPFFDSVKVSSFTTQSSQLVIPRTTAFSSTVRAGGDSSEPARLVNGNSESALDRGDVVFVKQRGGATYTKETSPATAVLALVSNKLNDTTTVLQVVNINGTFQAGDVLEGSITGATSTLSSVTVSTKGNPLVSNAAGEIVGIFDIPNTDSNRFRTGVREFKLSDDTNNSVQSTSSARKQYRAEGIIETKQASFTATRNADVRQETINEYQVIRQDSSRVVSDTGWYDPLAQTFLVQSPGGAFVTSVDIFFASKDENIPVKMQIREVVNGYPGKVIIPFSETSLTPEEVNISTILVDTTDGETLPSPVASRFKFDSPVYLNDSTEYCIILISDSNKYKCWISQLGQQSVVNNRIISEQPYAGVLFKSQNASTWTANQNQDLMFKINKAKFTTGQYGEVDFVNNAIPSLLLKTNPFYAVNGTNYLRVTHENNGLIVGGNVTISGADSVAGIPNAEINKTHTVVSVDYDSYVIQVTTNATFTGNFGGSAVKSSENIQYTTVQPIVQSQSFSNTDLSFLIQTHAGKSVNGTEIPYGQSSFSDVAVNENNDLLNIQIIGNTSTEIDEMNGEKSVTLRARMLSYNENISPVIDIARLSMIAVQDRINWPTEANTNNANLDTRNIVSANATVSITDGNRLTTSDVTTKTSFKTVNIGRYITTSGFATGSNNGKFLVTEVAEDGSYIAVKAALTNVVAGPGITINSLDRFVDETAPSGSSSVAKYTSKKINIQNPSTFLKIKFAADVEQRANIDVYYKIQEFGTTKDFNKTPYILATPNLAPVKSDNGVYSDVEYDIPNLPTFNAVQVKLVMNSTSAANVVRVKDLQIIGCA